MDHQLEHCDVGDIIGYGGALTIQLIEQDLLKELFLFDLKKSINVCKKIKKKLKVFNQIPIIQTNMIKS